MVALDSLPVPDPSTSIDVVDLLGTGTACLVWSSPLPQDRERALRYVDLMGGRKPHVLTAMRNNLGAETRLRYAPSTKFFVEDRRDGTPWVTKLPFPVHVVGTVETFDHVSRRSSRRATATTTGTSIHASGSFAASARSSSGTPRPSPSTRAPGCSRRRRRSRERSSICLRSGPSTFSIPARIALAAGISRLYEDEYYQGDPAAPLLPDTELPTNLTPREAREACRALRGLLLRREVYAEDGSARAAHPYTVSEHAYRLKTVQERHGNRHAVFVAIPSEVLTHHYEREPSDPRLTHELTLEVDAFGNVTKSASVAYPRRPVPDRLPEQASGRMTYTERWLENPTTQQDWYRTGVPIEERTYEVTGLAWNAPFAPDTLKAQVAAAQEIPYEQVPTAQQVQRRLVEHSRTIYRRDDLSGPLPLGTVESLALPQTELQLALTSGLVSEVYGQDVTDALLEGPEARYVHSEGDDHWWIPEGEVFYSPYAAHSTAQELLFARQHFFLPHRYRDAFGNETVVHYAYDLLPSSVEDAVNNVMTAEYHYRTLQPLLVTHANGNRDAARYDALGALVRTFAMGRPGQNEGDLFDLTSVERSPADDPTAIQEYDLWAWADRQQPVSLRSRVRERHGQPTRWQESYSYFDGTDREIIKKAQAEPGVVRQLDANGNVIEVDTTPDLRWVGTGRVVFDNKGNPVKQYEPFFSVTSEFETEEQLVASGVTPVLRHDPLGRLVRIDHPDGTLTRRGVRRVEPDDVGPERHGAREPVVRPARRPTPE